MRPSFMMRQSPVRKAGVERQRDWLVQRFVVQRTNRGRAFESFSAYRLRTVCIPPLLPMLSSKRKKHEAAASLDDPSHRRFAAFVS